MVIESDILKQLLSIQSAVFGLADGDTVLEYLACLLTDLPGVCRSGYIPAPADNNYITQNNEELFRLCFDSKNYGSFVLEISDHELFSTYKDCLGHFFISICHFVESKNQINNLVEEKTSEFVKKSQESQSQVVMQDKLGSLRQLIAGIAHEINNPLGAIESSRDVLSDCLLRILDSLAEIAQWLACDNGPLLADLIEAAKTGHNSLMELSTRDRRQFRDNYSDLFRLSGIEDYQILSRKMVELCVYEDIEKYIPLLKEEDVVDKLDGIADIVDAFAASETIKTAVSKTSKMIKALNSYIKNETDFSSGDAMRVNIEIGQSLENVLFLFQSSIKSHIQLEFEVEDELPLIYGVSDEINQVWTNVIQNAIQAMEDKGKLSVKALKYDGGVVVHVTDEGCGMNEETKSKIFEPMFTTRPPGEGVGLGMNIVEKVVQKHFGKVEVKSEEGKGTTVSIYLPVEQ